MDASVWVAKTGLTAQQRRMTVIANNLANVIPSHLNGIEQFLKTCFTKISASPAPLPMLRPSLLRV